MKMIMSFVLAGMGAVGISQEVKTVDHAEKALILVRVSEGGFMENQIAQLYTAAKNVSEVKMVHERRINELKRASAQLEQVVAILAMGRQISDEQKVLLERAVREREQAETQLRERIEAEVRSVFGVLSDDQKVRMGASDEAKRRVAETMNSLRNTSPQEWNRVRDNIAGTLIRSQIRNYRRTQETALRQMRQSGASQDQVRQQERVNREEERQMRNSAIAYVDRMRNGNTRQLQEFEQRLMIEVQGQESLNRRVFDYIRNIITADMALDALSMRLAEIRR